MIKDKIVKAWKSSGLSKKTLSEISGIRYASLVDYINGKKDLEGSNISKLFEALKIKFK